MHIVHSLPCIVLAVLVSILLLSATFRSTEQFYHIQQTIETTPLDSSKRDSNTLETALTQSSFLDYLKYIDHHNIAVTAEQRQIEYYIQHKVIDDTVP